MSRISIRHDHIKAFISRFRKGKSLPFHQVSVVIGSSRFQFWVGYTTSTEKWPGRFKRQAVILEAIAFPTPRCYLEYLTGMFFRSNSAEREDEQHILLHDTARHKKCPCIPSSLNATTPRKMKQSRAHTSLLSTDAPSSHHTKVALHPISYWGELDCSARSTSSW